MSENPKFILQLEVELLEEGKVLLSYDAMQRFEDVLNRTFKNLRFKISEREQR